MAISDIAQAARDQQGLPWRTCQVCHALATVEPPSERDALRELLRSPMRYSDMSALLAADPDTPLILDAGALSRHCQGKCAAREKIR